MITRNIKKLISKVENYIDRHKHSQIIWPILLWFVGLSIVFFISLVIKLIFYIGK